MNPTPIEVLLVEDDPGDVLMTQEAFEDYRVANNLTVISNGEDAIAYLRKEGRYADAVTPGLVLLDLNLPRLGGLDVLRAVRADPALRELPVVVLTTSRDPGDQQAAGAGEADAFLSKPTDLEGFERLARHVRATWLARYTF